MKNFKFFLKLIAALSPVIAIVLYTALFPYAYMDEEYPAWTYTKDVVSGKLDPFAKADGTTAVLPNEAANSTIILGDSRAMADLNPLYMEDTVNLAVGGATSIEMYYTLSHYLENVGSPKKIIIMFAPFHYSVIDNFWTRAVYFNYYSVNEVSEIYKNARACNSESLLCSDYKNELLSCRLRMPNKYLPALMNSKFISRYSINKDQYAKLQQTRGNAEFGHDNGNSDSCYETSYTEMHRTGDALLLNQYMNMLVDLCDKNGIETLVSMPPMNKSSYDILNENYVNEFTDYMYALQSRYPKIKIKPELTYMDDEYFGDSSHLNSRGAEVFTKEFISNN